MHIRSILAGAAALAFIAAPAFAEDYLGGAVRTVDIGGQQVLTDANGMTLYIFDKDKAGDGKSVCNGECAVKWPPLMADADAADEGEFTVVTRDDGSKMWAHEGMPLYYWYEDTKPGDTSGDGVGGVWHLAVD
jgi:predicted lipoprotein with Yx(FWY)xxD motif